MSILVENVVCNERNPMENWMKLFEKYPDIKFVFDTKMDIKHKQVLCDSTKVKEILVNLIAMPLNIHQMAVVSQWM